MNSSSDIAGTRCQPRGGVSTTLEIRARPFHHRLGSSSAAVALPRAGNICKTSPLRKAYSTSKKPPATGKSPVVQTPLDRRRKKDDAEATSHLGSPYETRRCRGDAARQSWRDKSPNQRHWFASTMAPYVETFAKRSCTYALRTCFKQLCRVHAMPCWTKDIKARPGRRSPFLRF